MTIRPVEHATSLFAQGHRRWAWPLVKGLEEVRDGAALDWALSAFSRALAAGIVADPAETVACESALALVRDLPPGTPSRETVDLSRRIWGGPPSLVRRGVSRLCDARAALDSGDLDRCRIEVARAMSLLGDSITDEWDPRALRAALEAASARGLA